MLAMVGGTTAHLLFLILRVTDGVLGQFVGAMTLLLAAILALSLFHASKLLLMRCDATGRD